MWTTIPRSQSPIWSLVRRYLAQEAPSELDISEQLRTVMRNVPQPVALAVANVPPGSTVQARYHGATLSSFTSLTLHPYPLVAFSLRLPSRLADCIRPLSAPPSLSGPAHLPPVFSASHISNHDPIASSATIPNPTSISPEPTHLPPTPAVTISLLSHSHAHLADKFARPGLDMATAFPPSDFDPPEIPGQPPGVKDAQGLLHCDVVTSVPLRDIHHTPSAPISGGDAQAQRLPDPLSSATVDKDIQGSELFICRVSGVKHGDEGLHIDPLLYWRRKYISVQNQSEHPYTW